MVPLLMINKAICCQCVLWLKSKIAKISTLKVKRIAKSLKFDPVNNSSLKVIHTHIRSLGNDDESPPTG